LALEREGHAEEAIRVLGQMSRGNPLDAEANCKSDWNAWLEEELLKFLPQADPDDATLLALRKGRSRRPLPPGQPRR